MRLVGEGCGANQAGGASARWVPGASSCVMTTVVFCIAAAPAGLFSSCACRSKAVGKRCPAAEHLLH